MFVVKKLIIVGNPVELVGIIHCVPRLMCEHDGKLPGLSKIPIVCGSVSVTDPDSVVINKKTYDIGKIKKDDFDDTRKILNSNTLRTHVAKKNPTLAKMMYRAARHTEFR